MLVYVVVLLLVGAVCLNVADRAFDNKFVAYPAVTLGMTCMVAAFSCAMTWLLGVVMAWTV